MEAGGRECHWKLRLPGEWFPYKGFLPYDNLVLILLQKDPSSFFTV